MNAENPPLTDQPDGADVGPEELSRTELEHEEGEPLPDREGTMNALSDQATVERDPDAVDETTTKGGLDV